MFLKSEKTRSAHIQGFTLLEILVAIFVFSILFSILFGSFRFISTSTDAIGNGTEAVEMGRQCISRLVTDISSTKVALAPEFKHPDLRETEDPYRVVGSSESIDGTEFSRIRFTAPRHFSFQEDQLSGMAEIVYYVHQLQGGECVLRRSDQMYPFEDFEEKSADPIVCRRVQGFTLTYFDDEGSENDEWDSESSQSDYGTPRSVQVVLKIGSEESPNSFTTRIYLPVYREQIS